VISLFLFPLALYVQSHAPERPQAQKDGNVFWLEAATDRAVRMLLAQRKYIGRIVDEPSGERNSGLICLEEPSPRDTKSAEILPRYIAKLATYTERECRSLIREVALIIKQSHDNGMAHRNLLLTNLLVDRTVRATVTVRVL
jgi:hypothetical protein